MTSLKDDFSMLLLIGMFMMIHAALLDEEPVNRLYPVDPYLWWG